MPTSGRPLWGEAFVVEPSPQPKAEEVIVAAAVVLRNSDPTPRMNSLRSTRLEALDSGFEERSSDMGDPPRHDRPVCSDSALHNPHCTRATSGLCSDGSPNTRFSGDVPVPEGQSARAVAGAENARHCGGLARGRDPARAPSSRHRGREASPGYGSCFVLRAAGAGGK